jgi:hypothetical protein
LDAGGGAASGKLLVAGGDGGQLLAAGGGHGKLLVAGCGSGKLLNGRQRPRRALGLERQQAHHGSIMDMAGEALVMHLVCTCAYE